MDDDIRHIAKYETKCTGCGACVNVCPVGAIKLTERDGYSLFLSIDFICDHCSIAYACGLSCPDCARKIYGGRENDFLFGHY
jgi:ferredoxin